MAPGITRRAVLGAAAGGLAAGSLGACASTRQAVRVAVVWSGSELARFREVVNGYSRPVEVVSARNDIDAFLSARVHTANQPDVAILPQIGLIAEYVRRGWLKPIDLDLTGRFAQPWIDLLKVGNVPYGAWVKAAHKSLFWCRPDAMQGQPDPKTWNKFTELVHLLAASRTAPLAIGAADGWVLTDWLENLLIALTTAEEYAGLVNGTVRWGIPPVREALRLLAEVWRIPRAFPDGPRRALLTQHEESVVQVVAERRAAMVFEGDFVAAVADRFRPTRAPPLSTFRFPETDGVKPLLVGGDAAVVLHGSATGHDLVNWLTGSDAFKPWICAGGYLSPNKLIPPEAYRGDPASGLATELQKATAASLRFDVSDQLRGSLGGPDGLGIWKILQDFFTEVAVERRDVNGSVAGTCARLVRAAAQAHREQGAGS